MYTSNYVSVFASSPTQGVLRNERHLFLSGYRYTDANGSITGAHDGTFYSFWSTGVEWRTELRNADDSAVLSAVEKEWSQRAQLAWVSYYQEQPANDNRINEEKRYLENGLMAKVHTSYDQYNNPIQVDEYDYDQTLKRRTVISYFNGFGYQSNDAIHLLR